MIVTSETAFSLKVSQEVQQQKIRAVDLIPILGPIPAVLQRIPLHDVIGYRQNGTFWTIEFSTFETIDPHKSVECGGEKFRVTELTVTQTRPEVREHHVKASRHAPEPHGFVFFDQRVADWFHGKLLAA